MWNRSGVQLGPLITIIYVNDVLGILGEDTNLYLYAGDMLTMSNHNNVDCVLSKLQTRTENNYEWCRQHKLTINKSKTKYMNISNGKVEPISTISIAGHTLSRVSQ